VDLNTLVIHGNKKIFWRGGPSKALLQTGRNFKIMECSVLVVGAIPSHVSHLNMYMESCTPYPLHYVMYFQKSLPTFYTESGIMLSHDGMMNWGGDGLLSVGELMESLFIQHDASMFGLATV
jgi:hypothetical protein